MHASYTILGDCPIEITHKIKKMSLNESNLSPAEQTTSREESPTRGRHVTLFREFDELSSALYLSQPMPMNAAERIIFVVDSVNLKWRDEARDHLLDLKHAINVFIVNKESINKKHEYAIIAMNGSGCERVTDFTHVHKVLFNQINKINGRDYTEDKLYLMDDVFESIYSLVQGKRDYHQRPTRVVFLYSRYLTEIGLINDGYFKKLMENELFFVDVVFMFSKPLEDQVLQMQNVYEGLVHLACRGKILNCASDCRHKLYECVMKLLAHPLQRVISDKDNYAISEIFQIGLSDTNSEESLDTHM